ncbi:hypothetical protein Q3Y53_06100 [Synechococcus sp. YX-04-1]|uniref:hypothetical protein n=1 Tax=Synechococcus sp. YX-04-1 TaxID=3062778 RepID=UPI0026E232D1|nr:hypothetical protein [Synechococcus sp. YX-04-1]MDO6352114.1 hypothetical protein [Synechococcus sp. YX-04-1]
MKFRKWFRRISILKYPAVIVFGIWGSVPALQPGVSGLKSQGDFLFGDDTVRRIELNKINLNSHSTPNWCFQHSYGGREKDFHYAICSFGNTTQKQIKEMGWNGVWKGPETIYKVGDVLQDQSYLWDSADFNRDWKWLEFFYGYNPSSKFGAALLGLAYVHMKAAFFAVIAFILFLVFDAFVLTFFFLRFALNKLKR